MCGMQSVVSRWTEIALPAEEDDDVDVVAPERESARKEGILI